MITIEEINKKQIWEVIQPIKKIVERVKYLKELCKGINLEDIKNKIFRVSSQIKFNESEHRYFYNGEECIPVSNVIDFFVQETDFDKIAKNYARKNNLNWEEVKETWNNKARNSTTNGTFIHQYGEDLNYICNQEEGNIRLKEWCYKEGYYFPINSKQVAIYKYFEYCLSNKEIPFLAEVKLILKEHNISGTFDQLVYSIPEKGFILRDYKTNGELTKSFKKSMNEPFEYLNDEPLSHYYIQQNIYSLMLKEAVGIELKKKQLVWLKDNETFELITLPNIEEKVLKAIESLY